MKNGSPPHTPVRTFFIRFLLGLYPHRLRRKYGPEMEAFLESRLARAKATGGRTATFGVWRRAVIDLVVTDFAELTRPPKKNRNRRERLVGVGAFFLDLRYAVRRLARTPVFSIGALAIMAIAIGATTTVFAGVNRVLLTPPPFEDPDQVVAIYQDSDDGEPNSSSFPAYRDMAAMNGIFESVAATSPDAVTVEETDGDWRAQTEFTTASFLDAIGMDPIRGRWFEPGMDQVGAGSYAVVSEHTWRSRFDSDPDIVGRTLRMNGEPVTVIGVGPAGFNGNGGFAVTDFWLSISSVGLGGEFRIQNLERRQDHWYEVRARLADGVNVVQAQDAMNALAGRLAEQFPDLNEGRDITVFPVKSIRVHPSADRNLYGVSALLLAIVFLVLALASSNLGSLLLVRGIARTPEVAVRRALGAARFRVTRLFVTEALVLSVTGGLLGVLMARWLLGLAATISLPGTGGRALDFPMNLPVLGFSLFLMLGTGLFFGWAPAIQSLSNDVSGALREDRRTSSGTSRLSLFRNLMVGVQVAVSLILVVGAGIMVRTLVDYQGVDTGVDIEHLAFLQSDFTQAGLSAEERGQVLREFSDAVEGLPGVEGVALASRVPVQGGGSTTTVVEDYEPPAGTGSVELDWAQVSPGYFQALGIAVVEGREYLPEDQVADGGGVVVNQALARFWGEGSAIGRRIRPQGVPDGWAPVIGVVADTKVRNLSEPPTPMIYYVMGPTGSRSPYLLVKTSNDPSLVLSGMRTRLQAVNPRVPVARLATMETHLGEALAGARATAGILGLFSMLALLLASVGIYTIVSFSVAGRMPEIGIRVALGADGSRVILGVMGGMVTTVGLGLLAGSLVVVLVSFQVQNLLYGAEVLSAWTLLPSVAVLAGVVGIASYIPARRAAGVDPVEALRAR